MSEFEYNKKERRPMQPPQNRGEWLEDYEGCEVRMETEAHRIAYFAREASWGDVMREPTEADMADTLKEVASGKVLSSAYKGGYGFRIRASRVTMDQMLRLAEGTGGTGSGATAQTTRDADMRDFNIIIPSSIGQIEDRRLYLRVVRLIDEQREVYKALIEAGVTPQDARYPCLPLGYQTQWFHVMSLGNLIKLCSHRLCNGNIQPETDYLTRMIRDEVVFRFPWMDSQLRSDCEKRGGCLTGGMLYPPCGAFTKAHTIQKSNGHMESPHETRLRIAKYDPAKHVFDTDKNLAMEFVQWDVDRQNLEREHPDSIFTMTGPPKFLCYKQGHMPEGRVLYEESVK